MRGLVKRERIIESKEDIIDKWTGRPALNQLYPNKAKKISQDLAKLLSNICDGVVCDIGCGSGRLAGIFNKEKYIGIDINAQAIHAARKRNPSYIFNGIDWEDEYPSADTYLFHNVLLHIPDDSIDAVIHRLKNKVVVCESMCKWFREYGGRNNYHRDPKGYEINFNAYGWSTEKLYHMYYPVFPYFLNVMEFKR